MLTDVERGALQKRREVGRIQSCAVEANRSLSIQLGWQSQIFSRAQSGFQSQITQLRSMFCCYFRPNALCLGRSKSIGWKGNFEVYVESLQMTVLCPEAQRDLAAHRHNADFEDKRRVKTMYDSEQ